MAEATVLFQQGAETATVVVTIDLNDVWLISGDFSGTISQGQIGFINGDVNLIGNVYVEGLLTGIDTFRLKGNGFTVFFQNGGQVALAGKPKAAWGEWGTDTTGWVVGDRLAVAPTKVGVYVPSELAWSNWSAPRPANSPDVTLVDGSIRKPEVVNLSQTIVIENLARGFHFHDSAGVQALSDVKFLNCGTAGVIGNYPIHFHLLGNNSRGSVCERVVVEGGKNHAFVPHGSHGISFPGCVAYNTIGVAYWWDKPPGTDDTTNDSDLINWDDTLALWVKPSTMPGESTQLAGYYLGAGTNLSANRATAVGVAGNPNSGSKRRSGFHWPENASRTSWDFHDAVGHNNAESGLFVWQNAGRLINLIHDFTAYRNGYQGINHGAYVSDYQYHGAVLTGNGGGLLQHAKSKTLLLFENIVSDGPLRVTQHNSTSAAATHFRTCSFPQVVYDEDANGSYNVFEDCELTPADFNLAGISSGSIIEVKEGGVLTHRWQSGVWS